MNKISVAPTPLALITNK